jgi:hypothetical protein
MVSNHIASGEGGTGLESYALRQGQRTEAINREHDMAWGVGWHWCRPRWRARFTSSAWPLYTGTYYTPLPSLGLAFPRLGLGRAHHREGPLCRMRLIPAGPDIYTSDLMLRNTLRALQA